MAQGSINNHYRLLLIGGSAGSLEVLLELLPALDPGLGLAIILVLHRKPGDSQLAELLGHKTRWTVQDAEEKEPILPGNVYIAPPDYHLLIEKDHTLSLDDSEKVHYCRPAIDVTFETAAEAYGGSTVALLLSGANSDGTDGLRHIKGAGGLTLVQDPDEAQVAYMPMQAIGALSVDYVARTEELAQIINGLNR